MARRTARSQRLKNSKKKLVLRKKKRTLKRMKKIPLVSAIWKEGKYYVAQCINVDVSSFGDTKTEALKNLKEALELYFEDEPLPKVVKINRLSIQVRRFANA